MYSTECCERESSCTYLDEGRTVAVVLQERGGVEAVRVKVRCVWPIPVVVHASRSRSHRAVIAAFRSGHVRSGTLPVICVHAGITIERVLGNAVLDATGLHRLKCAFRAAVHVLIVMTQAIDQRQFKSLSRPHFDRWTGDSIIVAARSEGFDLPVEIEDDGRVVRD